LEPSFAANFWKAPTDFRPALAFSGDRRKALTLHRMFLLQSHHRVLPLHAGLYRRGARTLACSVHTLKRFLLPIRRFGSRPQCGFISRPSLIHRRIQLALGHSHVNLCDLLAAAALSFTTPAGSRQLHNRLQNPQRDSVARASRQFRGGAARVSRMRIHARRRPSKPSSRPGR